MDSGESTGRERALLAALLMFGGGIAVAAICALCGVPSALCVVSGLVAMLIVYRSFR